MRVLKAHISALGLALGGMALTALGQLSPDRVYYGVNRPVPMTIPKPLEGSKGADQVRLLAPGDAAEIARASCEPGSIDLAALFPRLWTDDAARLLYAQAYRGDAPVGPAVVLQPLVTPPYAPRVDRDGAPAFITPAGRARVFSGYRAYVDQDVVMETSQGKMRIALRPEAAPNTVWAVRELVGGGLYTDILVHRVASLGGQAEPDVIQFGDPSVVAEPSHAGGAGTNADGKGEAPKPVKRAKGASGGMGGAGFLIDLEPSTLKHDFGVLSMARGSDPNSGSSQIVITLNRNRCASLDGRYAAFAEVVEGADVLVRLSRTPVDADYRTIDPPVIKSAKLVDAPPLPLKPRRVADPGTRPVER